MNNAQPRASRLPLQADPPWSRSGESSRALKERVRARAAKFVRDVLGSHQLAGIYDPVLPEVRYKKPLQFLCSQFMASLESLSMKFGWEVQHPISADRAQEMEANTVVSTDLPYKALR